jgi:hypothetical protein
VCISTEGAQQRDFGIAALPAAVSFAAFWAAPRRRSARPSSSPARSGGWLVALPLLILTGCAGLLVAVGEPAAAALLAVVVVPPCWTAVAVASGRHRAPLSTAERVQIEWVAWIAGVVAAVAAYHSATSTGFSGEEEIPFITCAFAVILLAGAIRLTYRRAPAGR